MVDESDFQKEEDFKQELNENQRDMVQEWLCPVCGGLRAKQKAIERAKLSGFDQCSCRDFE